VTIALSIISSASSANVRKLVTHAERACHAAQSLSHPVPVHLQATLNGQPLPGP
jgi:organic hydroperoxide reductase OsmC/OhrA